MRIMLATKQRVPGSRIQNQRSGHIYEVRRMEV
jgi:hypothetical protein